MERSGTDAWLKRLKRHPASGLFILICLGLIGVANVLDAGGRIAGFWRGLFAGQATSVQPKAENPIVRWDAGQPFQGRWGIRFFFVGDTGNPADERREWFTWTAQLEQTRDQVKGKLRAVKYTGELEGTVEGKELNGRVKFSWGEPDQWWRSFHMKINPDGQTATGSAVWVFSDEGGAHLYEIESWRIPE